MTRLEDTIAALKKATDTLCQSLVGLGVDDLNDFNWSDWAWEEMTLGDIASIRPDCLWEILVDSGYDSEYASSLIYDASQSSSRQKGD